jgi:hypothetical protein
MKKVFELIVCTLFVSSLTGFGLTAAFFCWFAWVGILGWLKGVLF